MQIRPLSPTSFWIEMPLSPQTCLLIWKAMSACGLRQGKINASQEEHPSPGYQWQGPIVEGRTPHSFFVTSTIIQAKFQEQEGGTLVEFVAANAKNAGDFGAATRVKRRLVPRVEQFLRAQPADWREPAKRSAADIAPPIASPFEDGNRSVGEAPSFDFIVPIQPPRFTLKDGLRLAASFVVTLAVIRWDLWGPICLVLSGWELWSARKQRRKLNWLGLSVTLSIGIFHTYLLAQPWF